MDVNAIVKLIDAGFTKEEIIKLTTPSVSLETPAAPKAAEESSSAAEAPVPEKAPEEAPTPSEGAAPKDISDIITEKISESLKPFEVLYSKMSTLAGMPAMGSVEPRGIDDIIRGILNN